MASRYDTQPHGAGADRPRAPGQGRGQGAGQGGDEGRSFRGEDAHLSAEMKRYNARFGPVHVDYGHDQNYRPGYHEGGSRFGFFGLENDRGVDREQEFDADYLIWRDQQMQRHDRDYGDWRREQLRKYDDDYWRFRAERRDEFHQRFQDWRAQRETEADAASTVQGAPKTDDES
jgi:hypothetical protein